MRRKELGCSGIGISVLCLGTMTWGEQNTQEEGFEQMDHGLAHGIDFFDTAELYPSHIRAQTQGRTEEIIGRWFAARRNRQQVVLASKVAGPGMAHIREGQSRFTEKNILEALEGSLRRLQTDWIDLYQLHWPDRGWTDFNDMGQTTPTPDTGADRDETVRVMGALIKSGKIRAWGVSNESAWGVMDYIARADAQGVARPSSIQNPYSLLTRKFETGLAEVSLRENVVLLAYAPIAAGALTGKYLDGRKPPGARMTLWPESRYLSPAGHQSTAAYVRIAKENGLDPAVLAHRFVVDQSFVGSSIIGATSVSHIDTALEAERTEIPPRAMEQLEAWHQQQRYPCP